MKGLTLAIVGIALTGVIGLQRPQLQQLSRGNERPKEVLLQEEALWQVRLNLFQQMPAFGLDNVFADYLYLDFIQYFGDTPARKQTGSSLVPTFFTGVVDRDPRFLSAYYSFSVANSIYAGRPDLTVSTIEKGLPFISPHQRFAHTVWIYKGTDELLFLGRNKDAQHSYEMAAKWASNHDDPVSQGSAKRSRETAAFLATNPNSKRARAGAWFSILEKALDRETQQFALSQIRSLGGQVLEKDGSLTLKLPKEN